MKKNEKEIAISAKEKEIQEAIIDYISKHQYPPSVREIGGIDLSSSTDLTCVTIIFMVPDDDRIYVKQMYRLPG